MKFRDANMQVSEVQYEIERQGLQSDVAVLKGLQVGQVRVAVNVAQDAIYKRISHAVDMYVLENFIVTPDGNFNVAPCDSVKLKLFIIKRDKQRMLFSPVYLPDPKFNFKLLNAPADVTLSDDGFLRLGKDAKGLLSVEVSLNAWRDNRIEKIITVVRPAFIDFGMREISSAAEFETYKEEMLKPMFLRAAGVKPIQASKEYTLYFELGKKYIVKAFLQDEESRELVMGVQRRLNWKLDEAVFRVIAKENDMVVIEPLALVQFKALQASLEPDACGSKALTVSKNFSVFSAVKIVGPFDAAGEINLPLGAVIKQTITLAQIGGSGEYIWSSSNRDVVGVLDNGEARALALGSADLTLSDAKSSGNSARVRVNVLPVQSTFAFESRAELIPGDRRELLASARASNATVFANCTALLFREVGNENVTIKADNATY